MKSDAANHSLCFEINHASFALGAKPILREVSLTIKSGIFTSIVGANGAGKSTLLKALAGLISPLKHPHHGRQDAVKLLNQPLAAYSERRRAQQIAWLGQNEVPSLDLSVKALVMLGRLPYMGLYKGATQADEQAVQQAMALVECENLAHRKISELSGGERQRVLLARSLAVDAPILLQDEPLANLDAPHQAQWLALMKQLVKQGKTVVAVLHELPIALAADEIIIMHQGKVAQQGAAFDPILHRQLEATFNHRIKIEFFQNQWVVLFPTQP